MNNKITKFLKHLKNKDFFRGAAVIFWKKENGKKYVLLSKRSGGYGTGYYSNQGGHQDSVDFEKGKWNYLNTAVREAGEETKVIPRNALAAAKAFFLENPDFKFRAKRIRNFNIHVYHHVTFACQVTGKMATEKWYKESSESYAGTMNWYALDKLPKKILFVCRLNILYVRLCCR